MFVVIISDCDLIGSFLTVTRSCDIKNDTSQTFHQYIDIKEICKCLCGDQSHNSMSFKRLVKICSLYHHTDELLTIRSEVCTGVCILISFLKCINVIVLCAAILYIVVINQFLVIYPFLIIMCSLSLCQCDFTVVLFSFHRLNRLIMKVKLCVLCAFVCDVGRSRALVNHFLFLLKFYHLKSR